MPQLHCKSPTCTTMLDAPGYCPAHAHLQVTDTAIRQRFYDEHQRDPEAKKFYNSAAWIRVRNDVLADHPVCQHCGREFAKHVHHTKPLKNCTPDEKVDCALLLAVCIQCHNILESEACPVDEYQPATQLKVVEDETYRFDPVAADRPILFIEKYCVHYEGRAFSGQPFKLLGWQKHIIRTLFGWVHRETGLRRFRELYLLTAKGAGKTPMLSAIGLYMLLMDGEPSPHVISMAATFEQANLTFGAGKNYIRLSKRLAAHVEVLQYMIRTNKAQDFGKWTTVSGKPNGRSGTRPSCVIADEVHEWPASATETLEMIAANLFKRTQPLLMFATNAGKSRNCFAWTLHQRALKVLAGELVEPTLLPVIYEAPKDMPWDSEAAAAAANPSLGSVVVWAQLADKVAKAKESPAEEAKYRRLQLSQWVTGSDKWLRMESVQAAQAPVDPEALKALPLYIGLDLSQGDDLCAAVFLWVSPERYYVTSRFWCPAATASHYQDKEGIPYDSWIASGDLIALDETTITPEVLSRIAQELIEYTAGHTVKAVAYDRYKANKVISTLEAAGMTCVPVAQGYSVSPGCHELERRLKAESITIHPNAVMMACASNVEVKTDDRGNMWPVKPNAKGKYAGKRGAKIDGIAALVTCITEAKRADIAPDQAPWTGETLSLENLDLDAA